MKGFLRIWAVVLVFVFALSGCSEPPVETTLPAPTTTAAPTEPPLTPREKYDLARNDLEQAANWILDYTLDEQRDVSGDTYTRKIVGKATFSKLYQDDMTAVVKEQLTYGAYTSEYEEVYCDSSAFSKVNEYYFKSEMEPQTFVQRQIPPALIDSGLYKTITESVDDRGTVINFDDAIAIESWMGKSGVKIVDASGCAILDGSGALKETAYEITYKLGDVQYAVSVTVGVVAPPSLDLGGTHTEHIRRSAEIDSLDVPKMLLQVVGDVYTANKLYCDAVESIYSEAIPLAYSQNSKIELSGTEEEFTSRTEYKIQLSDYRGNVSTKTQVDTYEDGLFSSVVNGGEPQVSRGITPQQMRRHCEDAILSALAAPKYLKNVTLQVSKDSYRIEIDGNRDFVTDMMENITQFLQVDLDEKATKKKTVSAGAYLVIDRETGLPTAMGLQLERSHTIDELDYRLIYRLDHTLELSDYE